MAARPTGLTLVFLLTLAGTPLIGADAGAAEAEPCAPVAGATVAVARAIDGDTLALADGRTVHLAGIEAVKAADGPAAPLATAALAELARLAGEGVVTCRAGACRRPDRYGRLHADVRLADGRPVAEALVTAGLARVRLFPGEKPCLAALYAAEAGARAARRGLWALPAFAVRSAADPSLIGAKRTI